MYRVGLVYRDVKLYNFVFVRELMFEFKVIDFGVCVCFRFGMNFILDEIIMDLKYAFFEEFLILTDDVFDL